MAIVGITFFLALSIIIGACITESWKVSRMLLDGFVIQVCIFGLNYYILFFFLRSNSLHFLILMYALTVAPLVIFGICKGIKNKEYIKENLIGCKTLAKDNAFVLSLLLLVIGYQLLRTACFQSFQPRDNVTYNPLICQMVESGLVYAPRGAHTFEPSQLVGIYGKYITTPWYVFEASIASFLHVHSLLVTGTIMPVFVLLMTYCSLYTFAGVLFKEDYKRKILFLLICVILYEVGLIKFEQSAYMLVWPVWGKNIVANIICPTVAGEYLLLVDEKKVPCCKLIWITLLVFAGTVASAATMMAIPVEVGALALTYTIRQRRFMPIAVAMACIIPCVLEFLLLVFYQHGSFDRWLGGTVL